MRKSVETGALNGEKRESRCEPNPSEDESSGKSPSCGPAKGPVAMPSTQSPSGSTNGSDFTNLADDENLNDARLVERARHGDHAAFAVLLRRYERKLIRVLTRLVRDPESARDLAQETFWKVYDRLEQFDTARRFGPWLFRVGVNLGLDWLRKNRAEPGTPASIDRVRGDGDLPFELPDPDPRAQVDLAQEVQHVLAQLPVSYRTILVLRDTGGVSHIGGRGHRRKARSDDSLAPCQGSREIPRDLAATFRRVEPRSHGRLGRT